MCQTNLFVDRYPDGREVTFTQTQFCQYSTPGRPCQKHSTISHQARTINFTEPTTEYMMTRKPYYPQQPHGYPNTPPQSRGRDDSPPRPIQRRQSKRQSVTILPRSDMPLPALKPHREHRKERVVIVDSPPTPRTPPMRFSRPQVFTAPSSPANPSYGFDTVRHERGRPIIVDERTGGPRTTIRRSRERESGYGRARDDSRAANVGERLPIPMPSSSPRTQRRNPSLDRGVFQWDSPSSSHTSFDSRARREAEEAKARARALERERCARRTQAEQEKEKSKSEAQKVMEARIRAQNEKIRARPVVPLPKSALKRRESMRATYEQPAAPREVPRVVLNGLATAGGGVGMSAGELKLAEEKEIRRRLEVRDWEAKREREARERSTEMRERERSTEMRERERSTEMRERERSTEMRERERESEEEVLKRLRERQMPRRRFSVGPGGRRHRVLYDDGAYRWE